MNVPEKVPDRAWGGFSLDEADEIARIAETQGWQTAAHDYMRSLDHRAYRLAIDEYLAQMRFLLPLDGSSRVLHARCGWGSLAVNLATFVESVVALDDRPAALRFLSARKRQAELHRLHVVESRPTSSLPFADGAFDAVIVSDAFQEDPAAVGDARRSGRPAYLADIRRVLRPGGTLLIGGANRLGIARPPRVGTEAPDTYWGYARALRSAGFSGLQVFAPLPSHREPMFIVPLDQPRLLSFFLDRMFAAHDYRTKLRERGLSSVYWLASTMWGIGHRLRLTGAVRYFVPSFLILTQR